MNPDNPYAAPQTLQPQQNATPLPVAEGLGDPARQRMFVEWDTVRLTALWERSRAIYDMQALWLLMCFVMPVLAFFFSLSFAVYDFYFDTTRGIIAVCCVALTFIRFGTGYARTRFGRVLALAMDPILGLFSVVLAVVIIAALFAGGALLVFFLPIAILISMQTVRSLRAMIQAPELFGPVRLRHQDLCDEVEQREKHEID